MRNPLPPDPKAQLFPGGLGSFPSLVFWDRSRWFSLWGKGTLTTIDGNWGTRTHTVLFPRPKQWLWESLPFCHGTSQDEQAEVPPAPDSVPDQLFRL